MLSAFEGAIASRNPRSVLVAGSSAFRAGANVAVGRFGWADPVTGFVLNSRSLSNQARGLIAPPYFGWRGPSLRMLYPDGVLPPGICRSSIILPTGYQLTLFAGGDFWAKFLAGAVAGQQVYANPIDGTVISGNTAGAELTPWNVITNAGPGQLALISTGSSIQ